MKSGRYHYLIKDRPDNPQKFLDATMRLSHKFFYIKKGKTYRCFCSQCLEHHDADYNMIKHIKASMLCPFCFNDIQPVHTDNAYLKKYIIDLTEGFDVRSHWKMDEGYIGQYFYHCLTLQEEGWLKRGIARTMSGELGEYMRGYGNDDEWRSQRKASHYGYSSSALEDWFWGAPSVLLADKKSYLSVLNDYDIKSNQKYLIIHNHYSLNQISFIKRYNLKTDEEVLKYSNYMKRSICHKGDWVNRIQKKELNVFTLDYLSRNNISESDYEDYMEQCEILHLKVGKPADFKEEHHKLSSIIQRIKNEEKHQKCDKLIQEFAKNLQKTEFKEHKVKYTLEPIKDANDVKTIAEEFHNCMYSIYLSRYAEHKCQLYKCLKGTEVYACIEINDGGVGQIRGKYNANVPLESKIRKALERMNSGMQMQGM